tara:strand:- start:17 stop:523 length:507 start_codon:yes stop_codon:yes gene_type:complete
MGKFFLYLDGFTRAYPLIIIFYSFLSSTLHNNKKELLFSFYMIFADILNHFIKMKFFKPLMGDKKYKFIGSGKRPQQMNCGLFIDNKKSSSYGMPSGHSQIAWLFTTYTILNLSKNIKYSKLISSFLIIIAALISHSRVFWSKCHTPQQVIVGAIFGIYLAKFISSYK